MVIVVVMMAVSEQYFLREQIFFHIGLIANSVSVSSSFTKKSFFVCVWLLLA